VQYLEQKLGIFVHGPSETGRRNAALEILTGRAQADALLDPTAEAATEPAPVRRPAATVALRVQRPNLVIRVALVTVGLGLLAAASFQLASMLQATPATPSVVAAEPQQIITIDAPVEAQPNVVAVEPVVTAEVPRIATEPTVARIAATPAPVPASAFGVLLDERFTSNVRGWPDDPQGTAGFVDGTYRLTARNIGQFVAVGIPGTRDLGDTVITAWLHKVAGPPGGGYGLLVRDADETPRDGRNQLGRYYVFEVGDRGEVGVWLRDGDHWVDLMSWSPSEAVHSGPTANELTVTAIGERLSFLVNGIPVASQTDTLLRAGAAGIFVGGDGNEVAVDRVVVRTPR
jgi:hypothetical protein